MMDRYNQNAQDINPYTSPQDMSGVLNFDGEQKTDKIQIRRAVFLAMIQQAVVLVISSLVMDGGAIFRITIIAALLSWAPFIGITVEHNIRTQYVVSKIDIALIKYSFWIFFLGMYILYSCNLLPFLPLKDAPAPVNLQ
jgi:hypothetical protein